MWKSLFSIFLIAVNLEIINANSYLKCEPWFVKPPIADHCCKLVSLFDEKVVSSLADEMQQQTDMDQCMYFKKLSEKLLLTEHTKASYSDYIKRVVKDPAWLPVLLKDDEICFDLVSQVEPAYAKKLKLNGHGCDLKSTLMLSCIMMTGFSDCPAKYYSESDDCNALRTQIKECTQKPEDLVKFIEEFKLPE